MAASNVSESLIPFRKIRVQALYFLDLVVTITFYYLSGFIAYKRKIPRGAFANLIEHGRARASN